MIQYCETMLDCRKEFLVKFLSSGKELIDPCQNCDNCNRKNTDQIRTVDFAEHKEKLFETIDTHGPQSFANLIDTWRKVDGVAKEFSKDDSGHIIAQLLLKDVLQEKFSSTAYQAISHLKRGTCSRLPSVDWKLTFFTKKKKSK